MFHRLITGIYTSSFIFREATKQRKHNNKKPTKKFYKKIKNCKTLKSNKKKRSYEVKARKPEKLYKIYIYMLIYVYIYISRVFWMSLKIIHIFVFCCCFGYLLYFYFIILMLCCWLLSLYTYNVLYAVHHRM